MDAHKSADEDTETDDHGNGQAGALPNAALLPGSAHSHTQPQHKRQVKKNIGNCWDDDRHNGIDAFPVARSRLAK